MRPSSVTLASWCIGIAVAAAGCARTDPTSLPELAANAEPPVQGRPWSSAVVRYGNMTLVAVSPQGVAAIDFVEPFDHDGVGVTYRYRFARRGGGPEVAGTGMVREKFEYVGADHKPDARPGVARILVRHKRDTGSVTRIKAGEIEFDWSRRDGRSGWIYFDPTRIQMKVARGGEYDTLNLKGEMGRRRS